MGKTQRFLAERCTNHTIRGGKVVNKNGCHNRAFCNTEEYFKNDDGINNYFAPFLKNLTLLKK